MPDRQAVATRYAMSDRQRLWKAAIKWRMYSVAVMPVVLAAGWRQGVQAPVRWDHFLGFLLAAVLLLLAAVFLDGRAPRAPASGVLRLPGPSSLYKYFVNLARGCYGVITVTSLGF